MTNKKTKTMKHTKSINQITRVIVAFALMLLFTNCDKEVKPDDIPISDLEKVQALVLTNLSSSWSSSSFTRDGLDSSAEFTNFILTIGDKTYSSQNGLHVWPSSGSWQFVEGKTDQITRDDGVIIDVSVNDTSLTLSFKFEENVFTSGGRGQTISSSLVFVLNK